MEGDDAVWVVLVASLVVGYAWGRASSWLRVPPMTASLTTLLVTGFFSVMEGWLSALLLQFEPTLNRARDLAAVSPALAVFRFVEFNFQSFFLGLFFGIPGLLGWLAGYRRERADQDERSRAVSAEHDDDRE